MTPIIYWYWWSRWPKTSRWVQLWTDLPTLNLPISTKSVFKLFSSERFIGMEYGVHILIQDLNNVLVINFLLQIWQCKPYSANICISVIVNFHTIALFLYAIICMNKFVPISDKIKIVIHDMFFEIFCEGVCFIAFVAFIFQSSMLYIVMRL